MAATGRIRQHFPMVPPPPIPRARRVLRAFGLGLAALLALDFAVGPWLLAEGELFGRALPPHATTLSPKQWADVRFWSEELRRKGEGIATPFDSELGWRNLPVPAGEQRRAFNSIGARGSRDYPPQPAPGTLRITSFGDSFTYCAEVEWDASWQAQLEMLEPSFEAINFGINGYGADQALLLFRRVGPPLDADVVCIGLMLENIGRHVNRYRPCFATLAGTPSAKPRLRLVDNTLQVVPLGFERESELFDAILDHSIGERLREHEYWADPALPAWLWRSSIVRLGVLAAESGRRNHRTLWLDAEGEPRQLTLAILESFHREALASGARAAPVLIWPSKPDLTGWLARGDAYWRAPLVEALTARGIPCIDLSVALGAAADSDPRRVDPLYQGMHLSREGNAVVAREVQRWLAERGIAPR